MYKEVQFKTFCQFVKTRCRPTKNVKETPDEHVQCKGYIFLLDIKFWIA